MRLVTSHESKRVEPPRLWREADLVNEEPLFVTTLVNKRSSPVRVEEYGRTMFILKPGQECFIESWSPLTTYSRYSKVIFERNGDVSAKESPDWKCPYEGWTTDLINGQDISQGVRIMMPRDVAVFGTVDGFVSVPGGLVRMVPLDIHDSMVKFKAVEWRLVKEKLPVQGFPNYMEERETIKKIMIPRAEREVEKIRRQLEIEALEAKQARAARRKP
jgi:hypothetical protein